MKERGQSESCWTSVSQTWREWRLAAHALATWKTLISMGRVEVHYDGNLAAAVLGRLDVGFIQNLFVRSQETEKKAGELTVSRLQWRP